MLSRGPTEQYFCVMEPHRGCLDKVKKVSWYPLIKKGQQSYKYAFLRANIATKIEKCPGTLNSNTIGRDNSLLFQDSIIIGKDNSTAINSIQTREMSFGEPL